ncbi:hypothetical protein A2U01_0068096, partial [Trifolium medium]|nr:hypothetical protein [Trifolium medium]
MVCDVREHHSDTWSCSFSWRRDLFQWKVDLVARLRNILEPVVFTLNEDLWVWRSDPE